MTRTARRLSLATALALAAGSMLALAPNIAREGDGAHRDKMSELEAKPFPADVFASLKTWAAGQSVSSEQMSSGGVVVIAFIDSGNGASMTMVNTLTRLQRTEGEKGLTVLAVHSEDGWAEIESKASEGRLRIPVARDVGGAFAAALGADDDPDVYLIDRAGQLRYADVETRSVQVAISALLRETPEQAKENAAKEAQVRRVAMDEGQRRGGGGSSGGSQTSSNTDRHGSEASPQDYAKAAWPATNSGSLNATDVQGRKLPTQLGGETWITERQDLTSKVVVLDFWATWCGPCRRAMPNLESLQKRYKQDLTVLGVGGQGEDLNTVKSYLASNRHEYGQLFDAKQSVYRSLSIRAIPHVVVMSTDGVVRWQGNPLDPSFEKALEQVLRVDPGLKPNEG